MSCDKESDSQSLNFGGKKIDASIEFPQPIPPTSNQLSASDMRSASRASPPRATSSVDDYSPHLDHRPIAVSEGNRESKFPSPLASDATARCDQAVSQVSS